MSDEIVLATEKTKLVTALSGFADMLSKLTPEQIPEAFELTDKMEKLAEEVRDRLRSRILEKVQAEGSVLTEKGSRGLSYGGYKVTAIPTRTGLDPKKLEAVLRRKGLEPTVGMDATVAYKVNDAKVLAAVGADKLTVEDVESAKYSLAFRLQVERE